MEFVHKPYKSDDTIAAVATPPGEGGVAIIRISGKTALDVAEKIFSGPVKSYASHTVHFGKFQDIDEGLLITLLGKRSYTGEDTVELHCHGGSLVTKKLLDAVLNAGARAAGPGEFTLRAFMNGKIDLAQAEAVQELIAAKSDLAMEAAGKNLEGALSTRIAAFQKILTDIAAILEAWVDFPEEGLEFASFEEVAGQLETCYHQMAQLSQTYSDGKMMQTGISLCLAGPPNAGKSSLMNALLGFDRAIVTNIPGTTRDLLEDDLRIKNLHFRLIDTAGIRQTEEVIEQEGIRRTQEAMQRADLILLVLDATQEIPEILENFPKEKTIVVWNKMDLSSEVFHLAEFPHIAKVSAKTRQGLDELSHCIDRVIWKKGPPSKEEIVITNLRHKQALDLAIQSLKNLILGLKTGVSPEFLTADMRATLTDLGTIIGTNITEDILNSIFSKFCIGK